MCVSVTWCCLCSRLASRSSSNRRPKLPSTESKQQTKEWKQKQSGTHAGLFFVFCSSLCFLLFLFSLYVSPPQSQTVSFLSFPSRLCFLCMLAKINTHTYTHTNIHTYICMCRCQGNNSLLLLSSPPKKCVHNI
jgi:hypothetical protein